MLLLERPLNWSLRRRKCWSVRFKIKIIRILCWMIPRKLVRMRINETIQTRQCDLTSSRPFGQVLTDVLLSVCSRLKRASPLERTVLIISARGGNLPYFTRAWKCLLKSRSCYSLIPTCRCIWKKLMRFWTTLLMTQERAQLYNSKIRAILSSTPPLNKVSRKISRRQTKQHQIM